MQTLPKTPKVAKNGGGPLSSRNGSIGAAVVTAAIAGLLIVFFLNQYRNNVDKGGVPTRVLVAQQLIQQGASGESAGALDQFKAIEVPRDQLKQGAVTDAAALRGKIAKGDILPGQQLTATDFRPAGHNLVTKLSASQRAMTVSFDSAHGLVGKVRAGDHVDVLSGFTLDGIAGGASRPVLRMLMQNVLVLDVPKTGSGAAVGGSSNSSAVTLRVAARAAPKLAFAADNGKLWLILRPLDGAIVENSTLVSLATLLADQTPAKVPSP